MIPEKEENREFSIQKHSLLFKEKISKTESRESNIKIFNREFL